jgi:alpha-glucosidase
MARFTVLTDRLIRMEYAYTKNKFEDRASLAVLERKLPLPHFTSGEAGGVLTISTAEVVLKYTVGKGFSASTLTVDPVSKASTFPGYVI